MIGLTESGLLQQGSVSDKCHADKSTHRRLLLAYDPPNKSQHVSEGNQQASKAQLDGTLKPQLDHNLQSKPVKLNGRVEERAVPKQANQRTEGCEDQQNLQAERAIFDQYKNGDSYDIEKILQKVNGPEICGQFDLTQAQVAEFDDGALINLLSQGMSGTICVPKNFLNNIKFNIGFPSEVHDWGTRQQWLVGKLITNRATGRLWFFGDACRSNGKLVGRSHLCVPLGNQDQSSNEALPEEEIAYREKCKGNWANQLPEMRDRLSRLHSVDAIATSWQSLLRAQRECGDYIKQESIAREFSDTSPIATDGTSVVPQPCNIETVHTMVSDLSDQVKHLNKLISEFAENQELTAPAHRDIQMPTKQKRHQKFHNESGLNPSFYCSYSRYPLPLGDNTDIERVYKLQGRLRMCQVNLPPDSADLKTLNQWCERYSYLKGGPIIGDDWDMDLIKDREVLLQSRIDACTHGK